MTIPCSCSCLADFENGRQSARRQPLGCTTARILARRYPSDICRQCITDTPIAGGEASPWRAPAPVPYLTTRLTGPRPREGAAVPTKPNRFTRPSMTHLRNRLTATTTVITIAPTTKGNLKTQLCREGCHRVHRGVAARLVRLAHFGFRRLHGSGIGRLRAPDLPRNRGVGRGRGRGRGRDRGRIGRLRDRGQDRGLALSRRLCPPRCLRERVACTATIRCSTRRRMTAYATHAMSVALKPSARTTAAPMVATSTSAAAVSAHRTAQPHH